MVTYSKKVSVTLREFLQKFIVLIVLYGQARQQCIMLRKERDIWPENGENVYLHTSINRTAEIDFSFTKRINSYILQCYIDKNEQNFKCVFN